MTIYVNSQDRQYILPMQIRASDIVNESASLGFPACASFAISGGVMLTLLHDVYNHQNTPGNMANIVTYARTLFQRHDDLLWSLWRFNNGRFSSCYTDIHSEFWRYTLDGEVIDTEFIWLNHGSEQQAERVRRLHRNAEYQRIEATTLVPMRDAVIQWRQIGYGS